MPSLHLDARVLDDLAVLGDVQSDERSGLFRVVVVGFKPLGVQPFLGTRQVYEFSDLGGYPVDDGLRDAGRSAYALPIRHCHGRQPYLDEGRSVWKGRYARLPGDRECPQAPALNLRDDVGGI